MPPLALPQIVRADFLAEARTGDGIPAIGPPEVAVAGRSNVGKSTLLNRMAGRKALARVSKTPGRTRGVMFYELDARMKGGDRRVLRLVDLPGYGYAQVAKTERDSWRKLIEGYVKGRKTLVLFLILVDARRGLEEEEVQLVEWLDSLRIPSRIVVTKADKLTASERGLAREKIKQILLPGAPPAMLASGQTGEGVEMLWSLLARHTAEAAEAAATDDDE